MFHYNFLRQTEFRMQQKMISTLSALRNLSLLVFCCSLLFSNDARADVEAQQIPGGPPGVVIVKTWLTKVITTSDALRFEEMLAQQKRHIAQTGDQVIYTVNLESDGGDVAAAMRIGRALRSMEALAIAVKCHSACVLVLAGAGYRDVSKNAVVGLHRPYQQEAVLTNPENEKRKYKLMQSEIERYLTEMNVQLKLYGDMMVIPPDQLKILTRTELASYGLAENDPYMDEARAMKKALKFEVSRQELARRESLIKQRCILKSGRTEAENELIVNAYYECTQRILNTGK